MEIPCATCTNNGSEGSSGGSENGNWRKGRRGRDGLPRRQSARESMEGGPHPGCTKTYLRVAGATPLQESKRQVDSPGRLADRHGRSPCASAGRLTQRQARTWSRTTRVRRVRGERREV